ncbi:aryl-alcohol dehydrogenase-like predicted oxidoreductase [Paenibacillus amylolyticus]|uniref:Aryl-alcohol dehydrogenase-like predicted oxidoreductase n=2 Tax=Paenibacillus amylolyticus TaxID=1451 RepID=A0AAP5LMG3_PAEAM|nr:aryl-alcohol dehydrogenase-like predicted oxidoreductase [Paenibacillus amylolyticus]
MMKQRILGRTGLNVPVLSFGASSLGSVFRNIDPNEGIRTVHAALDAGMNYIDVSPYYGLTKAETVLGHAIRTVPRQSYTLSTKVGRYGEHKFDFSRKRIQESVQQSLTRLHTDYIDMLFLHDIEFVPADIIIEEAFPTLLDLKEQGVIRFAGICGLPLTLFEKVLPQIEADAIISYCHYTLNDTSLLSLLPLLEKNNVGLVNASPLAMGLLSTRGAPAWHPATERVKQVCLEAAQFCAEQGSNIAKVAVQYATANEQIPTALVSSASVENIRNNADWLDEELDQELLSAVLRILAPIHNETWPSGLSEYH